MKIKYALLLVFWVATGCVANDFQKGLNGFKFFDPVINERFIEALIKNNVPYDVKGDGYVLYDPSFESIVSKIRFSILDESFKPAIHYKSESLERRFINRLKDEGINFAVQVKNGERWITWSEEDDKEVMNIRDTLW